MNQGMPVQLRRRYMHAENPAVYQPEFPGEYRSFRACGADAYVSFHVIQAILRRKQEFILQIM